jgi:hypothetical protein
MVNVSGALADPSQALPWRWPARELGHGFINASLLIWLTGEAGWLPDLATQRRLKRPAGLVSNIFRYMGLACNLRNSCENEPEALIGD